MAKLWLAPNSPKSNSEAGQTNTKLFRGWTDKQAQQLNLMKLKFVYEGAVIVNQRLEDPGSKVCSRVSIGDMSLKMSHLMVLDYYYNTQ